MQNEKEIIAAITLYLASEMHVRALADSTIFITSKKFDSGIDAIKSTATEIYTAIAPLVAEKDLPLSELFTHMSEQYDLTLTDTELGDIIHVARGK